MIIEKIDEKAVFPTKGSINSAGWDLTAIDYKIKENGIVMFGTGWKGEITADCFGAIYIRSGIASKGLWSLANHVGIIDSDYRGPIKVLFRYQLYYHNDLNAIALEAKKLIGQRIAQLIIQPYVSNGMAEGTVNESARGSGGIGSTGQ